MSTSEAVKSNGYDNVGIGDSAEIGAFRSRPISTIGQLAADDMSELATAEERIAQFAYGGKLGTKPKAPSEDFAAWRNAQAVVALRMAADLLDAGKRSDAISASKLALSLAGAR